MPKWVWGAIGIAVVGAAVAAWYFWPGRVAPTHTVVPTKTAPKPYVMEDEKVVFSQYAGSESCRACHADQFARWKGSNHGMAERKPDAALEDAAFSNAKPFSHGTQSTTPEKKGEEFFLTALGFANKISTYKVERVIGHDPLRQFLIASERGRFQVGEACFDPHKNEWFNLYGNEDRKPGEWGHWTGRGMMWNQMCAACHNTRVRKNYDLNKDEYRTTMAELTVSCESCHGPMKAHGDWQVAHPGAKGDPTAKQWTKEQHMENCAGCHARRDEVTGDFVPGESFWDHYHLSIVDHTDLFYPDGQIREEDYEYSSFLSSRMHQAGVRCQDCHDSHSMKTILPGNQLCMRCHTAGGFPNAPVIMPEAHSFHGAESTGNQCVNCHMPQTIYMQRHPRHDHGFTIPDPLLTKQFNVPNACNKCHTDKTTDWALEATQKWWGPKMERKTRQRATLIAQAKQGKDAAKEGLMALLKSDEIPYWKASATSLLQRWVDQPGVATALKEQLGHAHPLVRANAARALEPLIERESIRAEVSPLLEDTSRGVRTAAAWTLRSRLDMASVAGKDLLHELSFNMDQPMGQLRFGQFAFSRGDTTQAIERFEKAIAWDPNSPPFHHDLALIYSATGQTEKTIAKLRDAIRLDPKDASYQYELGLALNETGDLNGAVAALEAALKLDPTLSRAWYNLGLARHAMKNVDGALEALTKAEAADPRDAGIPYARATILAQVERMGEAVAAVEKALQIQPDHQEALQLRFQLMRK